MNRYSYISFSGLKLRFVVTSLPQQYGFIIIAKCPWLCDADGNSADAYDFEAIAAREPILLPISDQSGAEVTVPYCYVHPMYPLARDILKHQDPDANNTYTDDLDLTRMWTFIIRTAGSITDSSVSANITLSVYGSFVSPTVAAPRTPLTLISGSRPASSSRKKKKVIQGQAEVGQAGAVTGLLAGVVTATAVGKAYLESAMGTVEEVQKMSEKVKKTACTLGLKQCTEDREEKKIVTQDSFGELSKIVANFGYKSLVDFNQRLIPPPMYADSTYRHSLLNIMRNSPNHFVVKAMSEGHVKPFMAHPYDAFLASSGTNFGYMAYFSQFFKWWSGSLEFCFCFCTASFVSARVKITAYWANSAYEGFNGTFIADVNSASTVGSLPSITQTVKGQANICVKVPFAYPFARMPTINDAVDQGGQIFLSVKIEKVIGVGNVSPSIYLKTYLRPGEDFRFEDPNSTFIPPSATSQSESIEAQMNVHDIFRNPQTLPGLDAIQAAMTFNMTVEDLLCRWSKRSLGSSNTYYPERFIAWSDSTRYRSNYDLLVPLFMFNSGEISTKVQKSSGSGNLTVILPSVLPGPSSVPEVDNPASGMAATSGVTQPVLDFDAPFRHMYDVDFNPSLYFPLISSEVEWYNKPVGSDSLLFTWVKASPNFQLFHMLPPPKNDLWPWVI
jgi:hypothetical protein